MPIILGRPFLATAGACIDVKEGRLTFDICGERVTYDLSHPDRGEEVVLRDVKAVDVHDIDELDDEGPSVGPEVKEDDLLTGNIANLQLEESFVYKHGVLESWHLVGKKLGVEPPDPSSSVFKENQVLSVDPGGVATKSAKELPFPKAVRRGRTPFDWEAFNEMKERARVEDPP